MVCLCCAAATKGRLCIQCVATLRPASDRLLPRGFRLAASFEHEGAARVLMHHLKYRGITDLSELAADLLEDRVPELPLIPVPRAWSRRLKYGVDPAKVVADSLARRLRVPVLPALAPRLHTPRRAGRDHSRAVPAFRLRNIPSSEVVLVDDVVTTGATVIAAIDAIGPNMVRLVVAANVVSGLSNVKSRN